ncbi:Mor transcription activator family protein [Paraclostridium benzoelyticum]
MIENFNGFNVKELASNYNMSESYIRSIIRNSR